MIHACSEEAVPESSPHGFGLVFVKGLVLIPGEAVDKSSKGLGTHETFNKWCIIKLDVGKNKVYVTD